MRQVRYTTQAEFVICEQSIDTNHGYAQRPVENSEAAKDRVVLERKLATAQRQAQAARERRAKAEVRSRSLEKRLKRERAQATRTLAERLQAWEQQGMWPFLVREKREALQQETADRLAPFQQRKRKADETIRAAFDACERACQQERDLLRQLEDLAASERAMFKLDHAKDQVMTVFKLALANLIMWTRDHYFPDTYGKATWKRLEPFFRLPGQIVWGSDTMRVELRPFNDRQLTRDLAAACAQVNQISPLALASVTGLFGLFPLGMLVFRRNRLIGILSWLLLGLNLAGALCWALFQWDSRGPLLGLDLVVLIAAGCGPAWNKRWLVALGCGFASGLGAVLALWAYSFILYFPGILDPSFVVNAVLLGVGAGLVGEALRRSVERDARDQLREQPLFSAGLPRGAQGLSRRQVLFGLGGIAGLAATGVGATWLMRTLLPHFRPLVSYQSEWGAITTLSWSPNGQQIVSAAFSQEVSIWDATTGRVLQTADQYTQINAVAWSPDGRQIAVGMSGPAENQAPNVFLTAPATLQPQMSLRAVDGLVWSVAWSPDSTRLAIATIHVQVWEATTGKALWTTSGFAWMVAWSPDGAYLATADSDGTCQIWEASSGRLLMTYRGHTGAVNVVAWSPDSRLLASGGADATVRVWEALTGRQVYAYLGHCSPFLGPTSVDTVAWSPDGQRIASSGIDGAIHVWEATTGDRVFVYAGQEGPVNVVAWSPDGQRIASGGVQGIVQVWQPG